MEPATPEATPEANAAEQQQEAKTSPLEAGKTFSQQTKVLEQLAAEPTEEAKDDKAEETKEEETQEELAPEADEKEVEELAQEEVDEPYQEPVDLPPVAQYILDNLPEIQTLGHGADGKDKLFKVKRAEDLPNDFEFASRRDELIFNAAIASQELNARELLGKYQQEQQNAQVQEFLNQQALDVQADIASLQREGVLPEFKYDSNDPKFDSDPAVKTANEIYEIFEKTNKAYADRGRSYRISFADAADKYFAAQSRRTPAKETPKESPAKQEREKVAAQVSSRQGADASERKAVVKQGTTLNDILRAYNNGRI